MKIPKVIIQTSILKPPKYLIERIQSNSSDWEYKHFLDEDIIDFIKKNPLEEFMNSLEVFHSLKIGAHKADFFRYYYLYINGGVYIDSDAVILKKIDDIIGNYEFFTVQSYMKNNSMFNGFIGCIPKHPIIYQALKHVYMENKEKINNDYFSICKELYTIINNFNETTEESTKKTNIFMEELFNDKIAVTKDGDEIVLMHCYNKDFFIPSLNPIPKKKLAKDVKQVKIGITFNLPENPLHLFSNGINQNVLYLAELFLTIGYDCCLIVDNKIDLNLIHEKEEYKKIFYREDFKIIKLNEILSYDFDIIILLGYQFQFSDSLSNNNNNVTLQILKYMNTKLILYQCGNQYFVDSETILYSQNNSDNSTKFKNYLTNANMYDQIWIIPQMFEVNKSYLSTLYRSESIEVPFVWSNKSILLAALSLDIEKEEDFLYKKKDETNKKIAIFEPNLSIMKWGFPPLLICENAYRKDEKKRIEKVFLTNINCNDHDSINRFNFDSLNKIVGGLDLCIDNKIVIEKRTNTLYFMKNFADIAVSHQMNNHLNYLYLDLAWMGWPIVHNGNLCKDVGYYYEGFDYEMGEKVLNDVISNHEANKEEYLIKNRKVIERYLPSNIELQNKYKKLIENLFIEK